jgi:phosphoribosylformylglycinamidine cyclo-ligase
MYWRETGDISVWKGIVEDAIVMNLDDMGCVGCVDHMVLSSTIGRNKQLIPAEVIQTIIEHSQAYLNKLEEYGIHITLAGGETADVGDIVRTIDVGYTAFARMKRSDIINIDIQNGDYIVGFSSYGKTVYEDTYNAGTGSNGLTSARHDLFHKQYAEKYPESFNPEIPGEVVYSGTKRLTDTVDLGEYKTDVGRLVLSPTRTYLPLLKKMMVHNKEIHGIVHCSGGGQTKVSKFLDKNVEVIKNNLFAVPPLFKMIKEEAHMSAYEMYQVFNMGHRLECYTHDREIAQSFIQMAAELGIEAQIIGKVVSSEHPAITINHEGDTVRYTYDKF